jgi:hypothetical protein
MAASKFHAAARNKALVRGSKRKQDLKHLPDILAMVFDLLADLVVAVHVAYVSYVVLGEVIVLLGLVLRWAWIRNLYFRLTHLAAIAIVAAEAVLEVACPLTTWEDRLRELGGHLVEQGSFIGRLLDSLIFYEIDPAVLKWIYIGFAALVILTLLLAPPRWRRASKENS